MATRRERLAEFTSSCDPPAQTCEILCEDHNGTYLPRFQGLSLSEIKSEHIDGVIRQELVSAECVRPPERLVGLAHLCSKKDACVRRCNTACMSAAGGADVARRTPRHDQDIRAGSNRSAVQHVHSAMAIAAPLAVTYAHRANATGKDFAIGAIMIANEILWCMLPAKRFGELPRNPFGGRMSRNAEPQDLPPVMS